MIIYGKILSIGDTILLASGRKGFSCGMKQFGFPTTRMVLTEKKLKTFQIKELPEGYFQYP